MKKAPEPTFAKTRFMLVIAVFSLLFCTVGVRAFQVQVLQREGLVQKAERHYRKSLVFHGKRGSILDKNGAPLAVSMEAASVAIRPDLFPDRETAATAIARILGKPREDLLPLFSGDRFTWIARRVRPEAAEEILAFRSTLPLTPSQRLLAIQVVSESSRAYPNREMAAQVIGFTGMDGEGLEGLEHRYNSVLKGEARDLTIIRDGRGRWFNEQDTAAEAAPGKNLVLTLDKTLQFITESALSEAASRSDAAAGMAVVLCPKTGAIRAMAHYPSFNPNNFGPYPRDFWRNRAVSEPFEPGSTMKSFLIAGALDRGYIRSDAIYYCGNGSYRIGPVTIRDTKPHEWLSVTQILKFSSNIGSVKISEVMGEKALFDTLRSFGFGERTGIDAPGETRGILRDWRRWTSVDTGNIAFGQGLSASAVQLVAAAGAIANGGILMRPYLVQEIRDPLTGTAEVFPPQAVHRVIAPETANMVKAMMATVTETGGTGTAAAPRGYRAAGKTGTSQKTEPDGSYSRSRYIASFLGFAPLEDPALVVLVMLDEPRKSHYGGAAAGPAFRTIISEGLAYMNIPPRPATPITTAMGYGEKP
ncbi:penicillin-binding protein 2 [Desulfobotulus sp.]|jgi:cell division protein FtsI (penicillin-binding protein 3)|uniref:peptidoglycan D,D-transpeptidase FtsI family protein n=1 Tax=Desulfobotulus sp. TaxID=1940337 RepID=UPI002A370FD3|nr:penicillin-binding protein 2 [Desulfobotulus sp.]MDY0164014.1 penicillin-binding protein 2 [Desulfobotulus sp.]